MRKTIMWGSIFTVCIVLCSGTVSAVQINVFQRSVQQTMETTIAENDALMSLLCSALNLVVHNGLLFVLTQLANLYHSFSLLSSPVVYPIFEALILFLFSLYIASSFLPVSFINNQLNVMSGMSSGLPTIITIPLSIFLIMILVQWMIRFMKYTSVAIFVFLLAYTSLMPYWVEICYYTEL